jgi:hypothetical protein
MSEARRKQLGYQRTYLATAHGRAARLAYQRRPVPKLKSARRETTWRLRREDDPERRARLGLRLAAIDRELDRLADAARTAGAA